MPTGKSAQRGFAYLFALLLIALVGLGLAAAGTLWHTASQREREAELLFIGDQYRQAIKSYYQLDPAQPRLPHSVDDLLADNRQPGIVRHLRRAWRDPMTGGEFALIPAADGAGFVGVASRSSRRPFKTAGFSQTNAGFADAASYADWHFALTAPATTTNTSALPP